MRINKYRAWDVEGKKMIPWDGPDGVNRWRCAYLNEDDDSPECIVMRYSDFKDKNGVEVYEKDIYKTCSGIWEVTEETVAYWIIDLDKMNCPMRDVVVIGNVCEHSIVDLRREG